MHTFHTWIFWLPRTSYLLLLIFSSYGKESLIIVELRSGVCRRFFPLPDGWVGLGSCVDPSSNLNGTKRSDSEMKERKKMQNKRKLPLYSQTASSFDLAKHEAARRIQSVEYRIQTPKENDSESSKKWDDVQVQCLLLWHS